MIGLRENECFCPSRTIYEAGIVTFSLAWIVLILWLHKAHVIGIYITMLIKITYDFIKITLLGLLLIIGFGIAFYLLFYQPTQEVRIYYCFVIAIMTIAFTGS